MELETIKAVPRPMPIPMPIPGFRIVVDLRWVVFCVEFLAKVGFVYIVEDGRAADVNNISVLCIESLAEMELVNLVEDWLSMDVNDVLTPDREIGVAGVKIAMETEISGIAYRPVVEGSRLNVSLVDPRL